MHGVFLYAAEKSRLSKLQHQAKNHRLTLCNMLDMPLLADSSLFTFFNKLAFNKVDFLCELGV